MTQITKEQAHVALTGLAVLAKEHPNSDAPEYVRHETVVAYITQLESNQRQPVADEKLREAVRELSMAAEIADLFHGRQCVAALALIESALSELEERRAASKWQPIETAPRDGTRIIVGRFSGDTKDDYDGRCRVDFWHTRTKHHYEGFGEFNQTYWPATHWMPLPTPPAQEV